MDKNKEFIAQQSLTFLEQAMESGKSIHPISSLPYPKEIIREAILEYAKSAKVKSTLNSAELNTVKIYYSYLSNFVPDDQAKLADEIDTKLEKIGPNDMPAVKDFLEENNQKEESLAEITHKTLTEEKELEQEMDAVLLGN